MWLNLIDDETLTNTEFIYNLSYGKDSMAGLHVTIDILEIPVHRIVHAEVWATDTIPADLPPMVEFKAVADEYIKRRWGLSVEHICATRGGSKTLTTGNSMTVSELEKMWGCAKDSLTSKAHGVNGSSTVTKLTYQDIFYRQRQLKSGGAQDVRIPLPERTVVQQRSQASSLGEITGFATRWSQYCTGELKTSSITAFRSRSTEGTGAPNSKEEFSKSPRQRGAKRNIVHILGIAADEPERVARYIDKPGYILPLVEADWHEDLCGLWCQYSGVLSPVYSDACRSGCWFCHNQGIDQLRLLRRNYPDLWALLLKWDLDSPVTFHADGHTVHDFDRRFQMEEEGLIPTDRTFRWWMLDKPPKFVAMRGEQIALEGF